MTKKLMLAAAFVILVNFSNCKKYEDGPLLSLKTKTARLVGEWEVVDIDPGGAPQGLDLIIEFEKNGDFKLTYDYGTYSYSYEGDWEWEDKKEVIQIEIGNWKPEWTVKRLTNSELWFEDEDDYKWECEKQ